MTIEILIDAREPIRGWVVHDRACTQHRKTFTGWLGLLQAIAGSLEGMDVETVERPGARLTEGEDHAQ